MLTLVITIVIKHVTLLAYWLQLDVIKILQTNNIMGVVMYAQRPSFEYAHVDVYCSLEQC